MTSRIKMNTKTNNRHASKPLSIAVALSATNLSKLHARGLRDPDDVPEPTHLVLLGFFEAAACPPPPPPPPPPWPPPPPPPPPPPCACKRWPWQGPPFPHGSSLAPAAALVLAFSPPSLLACAPPSLSPSSSPRFLGGAHVARIFSTVVELSHATHVGSLKRPKASSPLGPACAGGPRPSCGRAPRWTRGTPRAAARSRS